MAQLTRVKTWAKGGNETQWGRSNSEVRRASTGVSSRGSLTPNIIKETSRTFDLEDVYKFSYTGRGLEKITCIDQCTNLEELDLSDNSVDRIEGISNLGLLRKLVLTCNKLTRLEDLEGLSSLEHLLVQGNRIHSLEDLNLSLLGSLPKLKTLYFKNVDGSEANPVCGQGAAYKNAVLSACKGLRNLDGERLPSRAREDFEQALSTGSAVVGGQGFGGGQGKGGSGAWMEGYGWEEGQSDIEGFIASRGARLKSMLMECRELNQTALHELQSRVGKT